MKFIIEARRKRKPGKRFTFRWWFSGQSFAEGRKMRITNEQKVKVTVVPKTQAGLNARIDGAVTFTSSDEAIAAIVPVDPPEPMSAWVVGLAPGVAQIKASFDADLGAGVRLVEASGAIEVVAAEATAMEITFGEPQLQ